MEECGYVIVGSGAGAHPGGAGLPKLACASCAGGGGDPLRRSLACPRITTFRHSIRLPRNIRHALGFLRATLCRRSRNARCQAATGRHSVSAGRHSAGWLHRAQRDDPDGAATIPDWDVHRGADRRSIVRAQRCGAISSGWRRAAIVRWACLSRIGLDATGHGWNGWLPTECATPRQVIDDSRLMATLIETTLGVLHGSTRPMQALRRLVESRLDPNDVRCCGRMRMGCASRRSAPTATSGSARASAC